MEAIPTPRETEDAPHSALLPTHAPPLPPAAAATTSSAPSASKTAAAILEWTTEALARARAKFSLASWQRLDNNDAAADPFDEDGPQTRALTAAERELQKRYFVAEDEWRACRKFVFFPVSETKQFWDFVVMACIVYSCAVVPYRVTFEEATGSLFWFEASLQLLFMTDVLATFNTAYLRGERWIVHRPRICRNYLSGWFWVDAPSSVPVELLEVALAERQVSLEGTVGEFLPLMRALRLFRLLRLLRLLRLGELIMIIEDKAGLNLKGLRMLSTVFLMLAFCHVLACVFYATAEASAPYYPKTWLSTYDDGYAEAEDTPLFDAYVIAVLWAIGLVCGQNTDITPTNMSERCLAILVYLLSALFFAYIIAVVTDQLSAYVNDPANKALDDLGTFVRFHRLPKPIEQRLRSYYSTFLSSRSMVDEDAILRNLTPSLRDEVMDFLLEGTVRQCPLLAPPDTAEERLQRFQEAIYAEMKPVTYERSMLIVAKNVHSDDLFFLLKGEVHAVCGGEQCLLDEANEVSYLAGSRTDLLCVSKDTFVRSAREHLDADARVSLAQAVWADVLRKARLRLWGMRIQLAELTERANLGDESARIARGSHVIQVAYLQMAFYRLKALSAVEKLPGLIGDDMDVIDVLETRKSTADPSSGGGGGGEGGDAGSRSFAPARRISMTDRGGGGGGGGGMRLAGMAAEMGEMRSEMHTLGAKVDELSANMKQMMTLMEALTSSKSPKGLLGKRP